VGSEKISCEWLHLLGTLAWMIRFQELTHWMVL
jgi:hypothetical protein